MGKPGIPLPEIVKRLPRLEYYRQYNAARKEKNREWHKAHPRTKDQRREEYARLREKHLKQKRDAYKNDPDKFKKRSSLRIAKRTPEQIERDCAYQRKYRAIHGKRLNQDRKNKINSSHELKLLRALRGAINASITRAKRKVQFVKKCENTKKLIGCDIPTLIAHIESLFTDGMNWSNHGMRGWHIDHILPCASFEMTDPNQQRKCFHYTNLQPLWGVVNIRKGDKILTPQENEQLRMQ